MARKTTQPVTKPVAKPVAQPVLGGGTAAGAPGQALVPVPGTRFARPGPALQPGQGLPVQTNTLGTRPVRVPTSALPTAPARSSMNMGQLGAAAAQPANALHPMARGLTQAARPAVVGPSAAATPRAVNPMNPPAGDFVRGQAAQLGQSVRGALPSAGRAATVLNKAGKAAGYLGTALEAGRVADVATDPGMGGLDLANQVASTGARMSAAGVGAVAGAPLGPVGALAGGALGYWGAGKLIEKGRELAGVNPADPAANSRGVLTQAYEALRGPAAPTPTAAPPRAVPFDSAQGTGAGTGPMMGPAEVGPRGLSRVGQTLTVAPGSAAAARLGGGGQIGSADAAGLARVETGLRAGVQPSDGQSFVSNRFMTVPAYETPAWLEQARALRAQRENTPMAAGLELPTEPEAPKMKTWDQRTGSFSDLGNTRRQNRAALKVYDQQMAAYRDKLGVLGGLEQARLGQQATLQGKSMENAGALERAMLEQEAMAPVRSATARYYQSGAKENAAQALLAMAQARAKGQPKGDPADKRSFQLIPNPEGGDAAPQIPVMVGQDGTAIPVRLPGAGTPGTAALDLETLQAMYDAYLAKTSGQNQMTFDVFKEKYPAWMKAQMQSMAGAS